MKRVVISSALLLLFVVVANAQTRTMTGTVIDRQVGNSGKWAAIVIKTGHKKYFVYTEAIHIPSPRTVGRVDEVGRRVRVTYTRIINAPGYDGELMATKIVEIKGSK